MQYSCTTEPENDYTFFRINVDKITHPDTLSINDTLIIKFYGFVGPNGCHSFSHFELKEKLNQMEITVWGYRPNFDTNCTTVLIYLHGREFKTLLQQNGIHRIIVHQPDNSLLIDSVFVK
jgi:hypothetical protein